METKKEQQQTTKASNDLYALLAEVLDSEIQIPDRIWCDKCDAYAWECGCEHYSGKSVTQRYKEQLVENVLKHFR